MSVLKKTSVDFIASAEKLLGQAHAAAQAAVESAQHEVEVAEERIRIAGLEKNNANNRLSKASDLVAVTDHISE